MTLKQIQAFVASVDPQARHYFSREETVDFTRWQEHSRLGVMGDSRHAEEAWSFQIDRFTRDGDDPVYAAFVTALENNPRICWREETLFETDTGYIHHVFICQGV